MRQVAGKVEARDGEWFGLLRARLIHVNGQSLFQPRTLPCSAFSGLLMWAQSGLVGSTSTPPLNPASITAATPPLQRHSILWNPWTTKYRSCKGLYWPLAGCG